MSQLWETVGVATAVVVWGVVAMALLLPHLKRQLAVLSVWAKQTPFRAALAAVAVGVAVAYGGTKPVPYCDWDAVNAKMTNAVCTAYEVVTEETESLAAGTTYVVTNDVTVSVRMSVAGVVENPTRLILCDGKTLTAAAGITVTSVGASTNALVICGQAGGTGALAATGGNNMAGIGGGYAGPGGCVTINGGTVVAKGGSRGGGIGGGLGSVGGGAVTINGGTVTAEGGANAAAIGGDALVSANPGRLTFGANFMGGVLAGDDAESAAFMTTAAYAADHSAGYATMPAEAPRTAPSAGDYVRYDLEQDLGIEIGDYDKNEKVSVKGLPAGLKLVATKQTKKDKKKTVTNVVYTVEGVPTAACDFAQQPVYAVVTSGGKTTWQPLALSVAPQAVTDLDPLALGESVTTNACEWLPGVTNGWSVSGLPTGLKYTSKAVYSGSGKKKKVKYPAYTVYGKTTKAGLFTITAKKKVSGYYETLKYRVLVEPKAVDETVFPSLTNRTSVVAVAETWSLTNDVGKMSSVSGLPSGLKFDSKKQTVKGTPTKAGTFVTTFKKKVGSKTKSAQILWTVRPSSVVPELTFNQDGGQIVEADVGVCETELCAFAAAPGATVKASGLPKGVTLVKLGDGRWGFKGTVTSATTAFVTVTATINGNSQAQRLAVRFNALPAWAKGTFDGWVCRADGQSGALRLNVTSAGKISGTLRELGTNWTVSASCFTGFDSDVYLCDNLVAKYSYKMKSGKKTVTKTLKRTLGFGVVSEDVGANTRGALEGEEAGVCEFVARQNQWAGAYKQLGRELFYQSKKKQYRTYTYTAETYGALAEGEKLTLKITPSGTVTATLTHPTGKKDKKTKKEIVYTATWSTTLIPRSAPEAGADAFNGDVILYFPPSSANNFGGLVDMIEFVP